MATAAAGEQNPAKRKERRHVSSDGTVRVFDYATREWRLESSPASSRPSGGPVLAIKGREFDLDFAAGELTIAGRPLVVHAAASSSQRTAAEQAHADTGRIVWDGAVVLAKYLEASPHLVAGKNVLELGAGTGLAGLAAAALGAKSVVLTDLPYCLETLERNAKATRERWTADGGVGDGVGEVQVAPLDWFAPDKSRMENVDVAIAADVVWLEELVPALVKVIEGLADRNPGIKIIMSYQLRTRAVQELLLSGLRRTFEVVVAPKGGSRWAADAIDVFVMQQRVMS